MIRYSKSSSRHIALNPACPNVSGIYRGSVCRNLLKPQRGDMCIEHRQINSPKPQIPGGLSVNSWLIEPSTLCNIPGIFDMSLSYVRKYEWRDHKPPRRIP